MGQRLITWARGAIVIGTIVSVVFVSDYVVLILFAGASLLAIVNQFRKDPEGDSFDRALIVQTAGIALVGAAAFVGAILVAVGVIKSDGSPAFVAVCGLAGAACAGFLVYRAFQYFGAGGGGPVAIQVWKDSGLDAMREYNRQQAQGIERDQGPHAAR